MDCITNESTGFNPGAPTLMHIDLNSCFAAVEQQANPRLRGKPVAVAAYTSGGGCILAASYEAKRLGVKTGLRVRDGRTLCPNLIVLPPDPNKYRFVNRKLLSLMQEYSADVEVRSIDEMVLNFSISNSKYQKSNIPIRQAQGRHIKYQIEEMRRKALEIKERIKEEIGEWLTVSIGISTNRFLAKVASGLHKPDGLDVIDGKNIETVLDSMDLEDLCGIKRGYGARLRAIGIDSATAFYRALMPDLKRAFHSIVGYHWWLRLHGWEADDRSFPRRSFGHSHALYVPYEPTDRRLHQVLCQLVTKMGRRLRTGGYAAGGVHLACQFCDYSFWHQGQKFLYPLYANSDLYQAAMRILLHAPVKPVRIVSVSCHYLSPFIYAQASLFFEEERKRALTQALDAISNRWGDFIVTSGRMLGAERKVLDRIAFGSVRELEEFTFQDQLQRDVC